MKINHSELAAVALRARADAYAPYSRFLVGAALLAKNGTVYLGCNIENASYAATNCAERTALFKAVSEGVREFAALAVAGAPAGEEVTESCPPCGICRQVIAEFCSPEMEIILVKDKNDYEVYSLAQLLPLGFGKEHL